MKAFRIVLVAACVAFAGGAQAQINPFRLAPNAPRLDASDLALMDEATHRILDAENPAKDATETWRNDATGASGKIYYVGPIKQTVRRTEYDCRRLQYDVLIKGMERPRTTTVNWCHDVDGSWKLL